TARWDHRSSDAACNVPLPASMAPVRRFTTTGLRWPYTRKLALIASKLASGCRRALIGSRSDLSQGTAKVRRGSAMYSRSVVSVGAAMVAASEAGADAAEPGEPWSSSAESRGTRLEFAVMDSPLRGRFMKYGKRKIIVPSEAKRSSHLCGLQIC